MLLTCFLILDCHLYNGVYVLPSHKNFILFNYYTEQRFNMRKLFMLTFAAMVIHVCAWGQCAVIKLNLGDCAACYLGMELMNAKNVKWPVFAVCDESLRADSIDIVERYKLERLGITLLFKERKFLENKEVGSTVNFFDNNGTLVWSKPLKGISNKLIQDSISNFNDSSKNSVSVINFYGKNISVALNEDLGKVSYSYNNNPQNVYSFKAKDVLEPTITKILSKEKGAALNEAKKYLNQGINFSPFIVKVAIDTTGHLIAVYKYYGVYYINGDTNGSALPEYIAIELDHGKTLNITPIDFDFDNELLGNQIIIPSKNELYALTYGYYDKIKKLASDSSKPMYILSRYILKDGHYVFDKKIENDLPIPYRRKFLFNALSLEQSSFPFLCYDFSSDIYNITTNKTYSLWDNKEVSEETDILKAIHNDNCILGTYLDKSSKKLHVFYRYHNQIFASRLTTDFKKESIVNITNALIGGDNGLDNVSRAEINPIMKNVTFYNYDNKSFILPLGLF